MEDFCVMCLSDRKSWPSCTIEALRSPIAAIDVAGMITGLRFLVPEETGGAFPLFGRTVVADIIFAANP